MGAARVYDLLRPESPSTAKIGMASVLLAACDGVDHQNFALLPAYFFDTFAGRHIEWLGARLRLIFGNHPINFVHVGRRWIIFEKRRVAMR
jgi:hypothetical protein